MIMSKPPDELDDMDDLISIVLKKNEIKPAPVPETDKVPEKEAKPRKKKRAEVSAIKAVEIKKIDEDRFAAILDLMNNGTESRFFSIYRDRMHEILLTSVADVISFAEFAGIPYAKRTATDLSVNVSIDPDNLRRFINGGMLDCKSTGDRHSRVRRKDRYFLSPNHDMRDHYPWSLFYTLVWKAMECRASFSVSVNSGTISIEFSDITKGELPVFEYLKDICTVSIAPISASFSRASISMCRWARNYDPRDDDPKHTGAPDAMVAFYDESSPFHDIMKSILNLPRTTVYRRPNQLYMEGTNVLTVVGCFNGMSTAELQSTVVKIAGGNLAVQKSAGFVKIMLPEADFTAVSPDRVIDPEEFRDMAKKIGREELLRSTLITADEKVWIEKHVQMYTKKMVVTICKGTYIGSFALKFTKIPEEDSALFRCYEKMLTAVGAMPGIWFKPRVYARYEEGKSIEFIDWIRVWIAPDKLSDGIRAVNEILPEGLAMYFFIDDHVKNDDYAPFPRVIAFRVAETSKNTVSIPVK